MEPSTKWDIRIEEVPVGRDILLVITGGSAHIGAVATAYYCNDAKGATVQTVDLPRHREHDLAAEMAEKAAEALRITVTVAAGIHYDGINREQISEIVAEANSVFDRYLTVKTEKSK
ncbi:hypothetical protein P4H66_06915 [Paenibacillus dokdonensis]|uniref:Prenylated flavin chaperone LpdD-like domain-containing protein n=1 Tax=Paenibacillus dokdonensis TaxID=2567944 RepID=A0ABU6GK52_9BACL|nr:hypothetical protein [Paenibacillus dokdonensis]MEC0239588.1 hypothetical protein [Paenibacillus dokdonensis]